LVTPRPRRSATPGRGSVGRPGGPVVAPDGGGIASDPALASWANFTLNIDSEFIGVYGEGRNGYNKKTNRFNRGYINPRSYQLKLDGRIGLELNRPRPVAALINRGGPPPIPRSLDQFMDVVDDPGDGGGGGGPRGPIVPAKVIAYRWVVEQTDGTFVNSKLVMRPTTPMYQAVFQLPSLGTYRVSLRVTFKDGTSGERSVEFDLREWFIVGIGDSHASGQGNPDVDATLGLGGGTWCRNTSLARLTGRGPNTNNDAEWTEPRAYRSMRSGQARAARALQRVLGQTFLNGRRINRFTFDKIVFASFARTGAEVFDGLLGSQDGGTDYIGAGQLEELRRTAAGRRIDALMISIGGNDVGFAGVLSDLLIRDSVFREQKPFLGTGDDAAERQRVSDRLDQILGVGLPPGQKGDLETAYDALEDQLQRLRKAPGLGEVYISGYPTSLFLVRDQQGRLQFKSCGVFAGPDVDITKPDGDVIRSRGRTLNALIRRKADEFGWHFVDVEAAFRGHGYCESDNQTYWVSMEKSCRRQGDFEGTSHPNFRGHAAIGLRLMQAMRQHTIPPPRKAAQGQPAVRRRARSGSARR
jgi:GDSL-like Lipase/Acylhydrolase family